MLSRSEVNYRKSLIEFIFRRHKLTKFFDFEYDRTVEVVASDEILSGDLKYQLYINFVEEKTFVYSYFYLGEDGRVWEYQISSNSEESLNNPVTP